MAMTVSTQPYQHWSNLGLQASLEPKYESCSPNLLQVMRALVKEFGAVSLGCHNQRTTRTGSGLSTHAYGAALDPKMPDRASTLRAMAWLIAWSAEFHINTIHDYQTQTMWKPELGRFVPASIGSVGGTWIHVETTIEGFSDNRIYEARGITSTIPPQGVIVSPEDAKWLADRFTEAAEDRRAIMRSPEFNEIIKARATEAVTAVISSAPFVQAMTTLVHDATASIDTAVLHAALVEATAGLTVEVDAAAIAEAVVDEEHSRLAD